MVPVFSENIYLVSSFVRKEKKIGASLNNFGNTFLRCWNPRTKKRVFCFVLTALN